MALAADTDIEQHRLAWETELSDEPTPTGVTSSLATTSSSSHIESSSTAEEYYNLSNSEDEGDVEIISRDQWGAFKPYVSDQIELMDHPIIYISFHYNCGIEPCRSLGECCERMRALQKIHTDEQHLSDIGYNFLVGGDTRVYEGRGWLFRPDKSYRYENLYDYRMDIAFIGDYRDCVLPMKMLDKAVDLVRLGVRMKYVSAEFECVGLTDREPNEENHDYDDKPIKGRGRGRARGRGRGRGKGGGRRILRSQAGQYKYGILRDRSIGKVPEQPGINRVKLNF